MIYEKNKLQYDDYYRLRKSVDWNNFLKEQTISALKRSLL